MKSYQKGLLGVVLMFGLLVVGCDNGNGGSNRAPEDKPDAERWGKWVDDDSTATLNYSVAADGVATIVVGGTEVSRWKAHASYSYTGEEGKKYKYTFEAWTESGTRDVEVQYYNNNDTSTYLKQMQTLTATRETFTIVGQVIPTSGALSIDFQCADKIGTFYVRVISITETTE